MADHNIVVRFISGLGKKREEILHFIEEIALAREGSKPPPPPQMLFGAYQGNTIVGTISVDFGSDLNPFRLEDIWEFDKEKTPLPFVRERIAQYGRWTATVPGASIALFYAATVFSKTHGKQFCLCEMKDPIARRLTEFGFVLLPIKNASLLPEAVRERMPEESRPYYLNHPLPYIYMMSLDQIEQAMQSHILPVRSLELSFSLKK